MIATMLLVCILLALAATAYFPSNEDATNQAPRTRIQDHHSRVVWFRNPNEPDTALHNRRWETKLAAAYRECGQ